MEEAGRDSDRMSVAHMDWVWEGGVGVGVGCGWGVWQEGDLLPHQGNKDTEMLWSW